MRKHSASRTARLVLDGLYFQLNNPSTAAAVDPLWLNIITSFVNQMGIRGKTWGFLAKKQSIQRLYNQKVPTYYQAFSKHLLFRKLWVERQVRTFCKTYPNGQVVIVGAGLDTLAARLAPSMPTCDFIEIDHPATQSVKHRLQQGLPQSLSTYRAPLNLKLLGADLSHTALSKVLPTTQLPVLFVMEGLLMYLPESIVAQLFENLRTISPSATAVFTFLTPWQSQSLPKTLALFTNYYLKLWGEPFEWVLSNTELSERLGGWHWEIQALSNSADEATQTHQGELTVDVAEHFCLAKAGTHSPLLKSRSLT